MKATVLLLNICSIIFTQFFVSQARAPLTHLNYTNQYTEEVDAGLHVSTIYGFQDEWTRSFGGSGYVEKTTSPINFWFQCIDFELRAYFFIEPIHKTPGHGKEAFMSIAPEVKNLLHFYADNKEVKNLETWFGGGQFRHKIDPNVDKDHDIRITVRAVDHTNKQHTFEWKHFTRYPVSKCKPLPAQTPSTHLIMNIHTRDTNDKSVINHKVIAGIAKHMNYHLCVLGITRYELVIPRHALDSYLTNPALRHAAKTGLLKFILKNSYHPPPIDGGESNCYWQPISQNLALLQHWKANTKVFFGDPDEYITLAPHVTKAQFYDYLAQHPILAIERFMAFCASCDPSKPEVKQISFRNQVYKKCKPEFKTNGEVTGPLGNCDPLTDGKLIVDPDAAGCFIIHWSGCGKPTYRIDKNILYIAHFENFYQTRFHIEPQVMASYVPVNFNNRSAMVVCDPATYDFNSPVTWNGEV